MKHAKIYKVGPNELTSHELESINVNKFLWFIYDYELWVCGGRISILAAHKKDSQLRVLFKEYCSEYDVLDGFNELPPTPVSKFNVDDFDFSPDMRKAIKEILHK